MLVNRYERSILHIKVINIIQKLNKNQIGIITGGAPPV